MVLKRRFSSFAVALVVTCGLVPLIYSASQKQPSSTAPAGFIPWQTDFEGAVAIAKKEHKRLFVKFSVDGCSSCEKMAATTFLEPAVKASLANYVPVMINVSEGQENVASKYNVDLVPALYVLEADGKVVSQKVGYQTGGEFNEWIAQSTK